MNKQEAIRTAILNYLKEKGIAYGHDVEEGYIITDFMLDDMSELDFGITVTDDAVVSYARLPQEIPTQIMTKVSEYIHRANYGLLSGNFEIDYSENRVQYKTFFYVPDGDIKSETVEALLVVPFAAFTRYKPGLERIMANPSLSPEAVINELEG